MAEDLSLLPSNSTKLVMGGSKRNKLKKLISPPPPPTIMNEDDSELMDDLLAQLDSRDQNVQAESANVLNEMNLNAQADLIEASSRQDAKSRFKARQVCSLSTGVPEFN